MQKKKFLQKGKRPHQAPQHTEKLLGTEQEGLIIAHFGASAEIQDKNKNIIHCHLRKNLGALITGDKILWRPEGEGGVIVSVFPRTSILERPDTKSKNKPIAANVDVILIVTAAPMLAEQLIDRYLVAATYLGIPARIIINKIDLLTPNDLTALKNKLSIYGKIGYALQYSSALTHWGLNELQDFMQDKTGVLVGPSGVGKSSLITALSPEANARVGEVSDRGLGKHTTTTTRLYHLPHGGQLIDSPGVREFSLWHMSPENILAGFIEFADYTTGCKFRNCQHHSEPGCHLLKAVQDEKIDAQRWESYQAILKTT